MESEVCVACNYDSAEQKARCPAPQTISTPSSDDAGQSTHPTSPTSGGGLGLQETIEMLFTVEHMREDEELLGQMNGRMLISAQSLCKHPRMVAMHPTLTADDIIVCGRSTKKFVLEEFPQGCFSLGPLPQAHQKSRCTVSLRYSNGLSDPEAAKPLCEVMPNRAVAQSLLFGSAPQPRILHHYWCASSRLVLLTFENDAIAKQAFLDMQTKKIPHAAGLEVRIRIDNQNAVFFSNQGAPINAATKPRGGSSVSTSSGADGRLQGPLPNPFAIPPMLPPNLLGVPMLGFPPFSPFLMPPFFGAPMMNPPVGLRNNAMQQQTLRKAPPHAAGGVGESKLTPKPEGHERSVGPVREPTRPEVSTAGAQSSPYDLPAIPEVSAERPSITTPSTPASQADSQSTPLSAGTKYRLDPYSQKGRVLQEPRAPADALDSPPHTLKAVACAPQTIDVFCLPQPRSAMLGARPPPGATCAEAPVKSRGLAAQFPPLEDGTKAISVPQRLPGGVPSVDQRSPTCTAAPKASYASILLGVTRSEVAAS